MTDAAPQILYSLDRSGEPFAIIERKTQGDQKDVLERYPGMMKGELTTELAELVNHFARKFQYEVIADPAAFGTAYREQISEEDPNGTWTQGASRLRDFGMPDLDAISEPSFDGTTLVFFAKSIRLGVPYRAEVKIENGDIGEASYDPMKMGPIE